MGSFLRVEKSAGSGYKVVREAQPNGNLYDAVFAAFVRKKNQPVMPVEGARPIKIGQLELHVVRSMLQFYNQPAKSRSSDSQALYLGYVLQKEDDSGMLLQYLPAGAHTSVHSHNHSETYIMLSGLVNAFVLPENARDGQLAKDVQLGSGNQRGIFTVPQNHYHPLVALEPSLTLIVAKYDVVYDQVYGTRNNHNKSIPFMEFAERFVASHIQRTRGPSEMAPEAGNP